MRNPTSVHMEFIDMCPASRPSSKRCDEHFSQAYDHPQLTYHIVRRCCFHRAGSLRPDTDDDLTTLVNFKI
jgi:hypothetical protein